MYTCVSRYTALYYTSYTIHMRIRYTLWCVSDRVKTIITSSQSDYCFNAPMGDNWYMSTGQFVMQNAPTHPLLELSGLFTDLFVMYNT